MPGPKNPTLRHRMAIHHSQSGLEVAAAVQRYIASLPAEARERLPASVATLQAWDEPAIVTAAAALSQQGMRADHHDKASEPLREAASILSLAALRIGTLAMLRASARAVHTQED